MASVITGIISKQGFELCRDAIGAILLTELTAQKTRQGNTDFPEDVIVLSEELPPADASDYMIMNIMLESATYSEITQSEAQGKTIYLIDFYSSGSSSTDSSYRLQKFIGMVGYIFRSAQYRMLGLPAGLIGGTYVEKFIIGQATQSKKEDSSFTSYGQLQLAIRIQEGAQTWMGVPLNDALSSVSLGLSDKGFQYKFTNS